MATLLEQRNDSPAEPPGQIVEGEVPVATMPLRLVYRFTEAAQLLGIGLTTLYGLVNDGILPVTNIGTDGRHINRVSAASLTAFIEERTATAPKESVA
ncbi:helix-turn-helix domain-containing protein [Paeniglutamicibacter sp. R2-26]|uniref:helix-turn-helix domain-containing protein n=1 Tax=Paeniglutamicibacter sp. R2-26 TaxID=3144417 RepID=UPI003EE7AD8E